MITSKQNPGKKSFASFVFIVSLFFITCKTETPSSQDFNNLAQEYVRLGLAIGQYDPFFVDAYYGPDSLKPTTLKNSVFPRDSFLIAVNKLSQKIKQFDSATTVSDTLRQRAVWIGKQLLAFERRIKIFSGDFASFEEETKDIFDVKVPTFPESHFRAIVAQMDSILPGKGLIPDRVQELSKEFIIPKDKIDTVIKTTIEEARKRANVHFQLPKEESFTLEYVTNKPWNGYNWYQGNYKSHIQINLDLPIHIEYAIDLACHEGYPGHHIYNVMLEKNLYRDKGWIEISLYPLFSPQSLIAEGSANYGIDVAFPGKEKDRFAEEVLFPLAGLDTSRAELYFKVLALKGQLGYAKNEAARALINNTMNEAEVLRWLIDYGLYSKELAIKAIRFIKTYRSYVVCYNYGQDLVKNYIESKGGVATAPEKRWEIFRWLLSNPVIPSDLMGLK